MTRWLLPILLLAAACANGDDSAPRHLASEDGVSFARLPGWDLTRERATLLLRRSGSPAIIAIRTVPRAGWSQPRDAENVFPAVATALRALPAARVRGPISLQTGKYPAVAFDVDFAAPGRGHFQRRHVTLLGDARVIHVFLVAPRGRASAALDDFDAIVNTIREETQS